MFYLYLFLGSWLMSISFLLGMYWVDSKVFENDIPFSDDPKEERQLKMMFYALLIPVSYTHLRAHETKANLVCRLLLEKKN